LATSASVSNSRGLWQQVLRLYDDDRAAVLGACLPLAKKLEHAPEAYQVAACSSALEEYIEVRGLCVDIRCLILSAMFHLFA
jgi:hypothetical protein